jgi:hypothetical protein
LALSDDVVVVVDTGVSLSTGGSSSPRFQAGQLATSSLALSAAFQMARVSGSSRLILILVLMAFPPTTLSGPIQPCKFAVRSEICCVLFRKPEDGSSELRARFLVEAASDMAFESKRRRPETGHDRPPRSPLAARPGRPGRGRPRRRGLVEHADRADRRELAARQLRQRLLAIVGRPQTILAVLERWSSAMLAP